MIEVAAGSLEEVVAESLASAADMPVEDLGQAVIMPGLVDCHVHMNEPGRTEWEGFATATRAAAQLVLLGNQIGPAAAMAALPYVAVDPGHGGADTGAVGYLPAGTPTGMTPRASQGGTGPSGAAAGDSGVAAASIASIVASARRRRAIIAGPVRLAAAAPSG